VTLATPCCAQTAAPHRYNLDASAAPGSGHDSTAEASRLHEGEDVEEEADEAEYGADGLDASEAAGLYDSSAELVYFDQGSSVYRAVRHCQPAAGAPGGNRSAHRAEAEQANHPKDCVSSVADLEISPEQGDLVAGHSTPSGGGHGTGRQLPLPIADAWGLRGGSSAARRSGGLDSSAGQQPVDLKAFEPMTFRPILPNGKQAGQQQQQQQPAPPSGSSSGAFLRMSARGVHPPALHGDGWAFGSGADDYSRPVGDHAAASATPWGGGQPLAEARQALGASFDGNALREAAGGRHHPHLQQRQQYHQQNVQGPAHGVPGPPPLRPAAAWTEQHAPPSAEGSAGGGMLFPPSGTRQLSAADPIIHKVRHADGKVEQTHASGKRSVVFANGTYKEQLHDGTTLICFTNRDVKRSFPGGKVEYYYSEVDTWHTTHVSGIEVFYFANGQIEAHLQNGVKQIVFPDGIVREVLPNGVEEEIRNKALLLQELQEPKPAMPPQMIGSGR